MELMVFLKMSKQKHKESRRKRREERGASQTDRDGESPFDEHRYIPGGEQN